MSRLGSITNNHLALECSLCGHTAQVAVVDLISALGRECSVQDAARKARCSRCHAKGHATFRIIFIGGSGDAMLGSRSG
jgi:hypothetical protein